jgi:intracellular septation protein
MLSVLEFAPVAVFGVAYYTHGIYVATAALMVSMLALVLFDFIRLKSVPTMHALSAVLVFVFGAATLILHNQRFIQWKPTVLFWLVSLAFLGSFWIGKRTLAEHFLGNALGELLSVGQRIEPRQWRVLNGQSVVFYALLGGLNLLVAFNASERTWVNFKLFGLSAATAIFMMVQMFWLTRRLQPAHDESAPAG